MTDRTEHIRKHALEALEKVAEALKAAVKLDGFFFHISNDVYAPNDVDALYDYCGTNMTLALVVGAASSHMKCTCDDPACSTTGLGETIKILADEYVDGGRAISAEAENVPPMPSVSGPPSIN